MDNQKKTPLTYAAAGVDINAGEDAVESIRNLAKKTFNKQVLSDIGAFGGFFKPDLGGFSKPVLISSADGVGTKLKIAVMTGRHNTVGEDLVNHCINDILVHGAKALFFLDYIGVGKLHPRVIADVVEGVSRGCVNSGVALVGGETAELPDFYQPGEYDLAGFVVGMVDQDKIINGSSIRAGDICIGLASNGLHTNGYTLARKVAFEIAGLKPGDKVTGLDKPIDEALMEVHRCYSGVVHQLLTEFAIKGMAHITGGGVTGNLNRILPSNTDALIEKSTWKVPPVFHFLQAEGNIDETEMFRAFNMGVGFVLVVSADIADSLLSRLDTLGEPGFRIGEIVKGSGKVTLH
jgi:phosphoribosylformylglycinamidine cyclo-ligase